MRVECSALPAAVQAGYGKIAHGIYESCPDNDSIGRIAARLQNDKHDRPGFRIQLHFQFQPAVPEKPRTVPQRMARTETIKPALTIPPEAIFFCYAKKLG